jgi:glutathione S-transferase
MKEGKMILIGMFDSPFVRRVAISMKLLGMTFEHRDWSVGRDFALIRQFNPLGRVPTLVLPGGEALIESSAILDYVDDCAGPERALIPRTGKDRRDTLRIMAVAIGAAEKGVSQVYESVFRPAEKRHAPWVERCTTQMHAALAELERLVQARAGNWLIGDRMTQADITATCVYTFLMGNPEIDHATFNYPKLAAHVARCEALPEFRAINAAWFSPGKTG